MRNLKAYRKTISIVNETTIGYMKKDYPVVGLQFHPESIYTEHGKRIIENFVNNRI